MHNRHNSFADGNCHHHHHHWDRAQHCGKVDRSHYKGAFGFDEEYLKKVIQEMVKEYFEKKENPTAEAVENKPKKRQHFGWTYGPCNLEQGRNDENHKVSCGWHLSNEIRQKDEQTGRSDGEESSASNDEGKKMHKRGRKWGNCRHHDQHHEGRKHHGRIYPHRDWGFGMNPGFGPWMMHPRRFGPPMCFNSARRCEKFCYYNNKEDNAEETQNSNGSESKDSNRENMMETAADEAPIPSVSSIEEVVDNLKKSSLNHAE